MKNIGIIGLGLIGGSIGLALTNKNYKIYGFDNNDLHSKKAVELGLVCDIITTDEMLNICEVIFVATPTRVSLNIIKKLLSKVKSNQVVIDVGSTKMLICNELLNVKNRKNYVAAHPIAGTENSGPTAAIHDLFLNKKLVICDKEESSNSALTSAIEIFLALNCSIVFMNSEEHDKHLAYISHLSHVCSFALGLTVLDIEKDEKSIFNLAGSGFSSTARLAKSSPAMWESILIQNKTNLLPAIDEYIKHLNILKIAIEKEDTESLLKNMIKANEIRTIIKN
ncbi:MAG: prephenate dehydrogenase [Flavobacteriales bacterium]